MSSPGEAQLNRAGTEPDRVLRRLWLVSAIDAIVERPVFLVGGAAVDLHTGSYQPTDVDIVGVVTPNDRRSLLEAGFLETGGRHIRWDYPDGTSEFVEFPESTLDGGFERIALSEEVTVNVIDVESLLVDRVTQATDGSDATFDEALRLIVATADRADWHSVALALRARPDSRYLGSIDKAHELLLAAAMPEIATSHFGSV